MLRRRSNETARLSEVPLTKATKLVNPDFLNALLVAGYLLGGTISIVLLASWALRRFGKPEMKAGTSP